MEKISAFVIRYKEPFLGALFAAGIYLAGLHDFLFVHTFAELFSIIIASSIFVFSWNSRRFLDNNYLVFLGIAYLFIGVLDLLHTFTYKGIEILQTSGSNVPTQLWIAARYMESTAFILAPLFLKRRLKAPYVLGAFFSVTVLVLLSIFYWKNFPVCYVEGLGLTPFKKASEFIIATILLISIAELHKKRESFDNTVANLLISALATTVLSELFFTHYVNVYGFSNLLGHILKILSFYLVYKAIIAAGLSRPYSILFKSLKDNEEKLKASEARYRAIIEDQTELICRWKPDGVLTFVNEAYCRYFGRAKEEFIGKSFIPLIPREDRISVEENFAMLSKDNPVMSHEHRVILPSGEIRWHRWTNRAIFDSQGQIIEYQSAGRDITERRNAEEELRRHRDSLESAVKQRTEELERINIKLSQEVTERVRAQEELGARNIFLKLLAHVLSRQEYMDGAVKLIKGWSDFECAGIRLADEQGRISYQSYVGFSRDFWEDENELFLNSDQCVCVRVIQGVTESCELQCMTQFGSFHSDNTMKFVESLSPKERAKYRGTCLKHGFASLAIIPISYKDKIIGAVHLADKEEGKATAKTIGLIEGLTALVGEALHKFDLEEKINRDHTTLDAFFTHSISPFVFLDTGFNFIRVNEAYAKACGKKVEDFIGHNHFELYPHPENETIFREVVKTKSPYEAFAKPFTFPDHPEWGITYWDWTLVPILDGKGEVDLLAFSLKDVTKDKKAEEAARSANAYNRSLIEASPDPLVAIGPDGKITDVNAATEKATGYFRSELIGTDFSDYFTEPDKARLGYQEVFRRGFILDYPLEIKHKDGRITPILYNASVYHDEKGETVGVFAAARDISELERAKKQLLTAQEELLQAKRLSDIGMLAATVAHELRNPLAAMRMASYNIKRKAQDSRLDKHIENIEIKINDSEQIINNLLFYSRLKSPTFSKVDIVSVMHECLDNANALSPGYPVRIHQHLEAIEGVIIDADKLQIKELFGNILNNAYEASAEGAGEIYITGNVEGPNLIKIIIKDSGPGIDEHNLKRVFDPFFSTKARGTGLGLTVCYQIAQLHGGSIDITSQKGKGASVNISLPLKRSEDA